MVALLSSTPEAQAWLGQVAPPDRDILSRWLDDLRLVNASEFHEKTLRLIERESRRLSPDRPIAIYVERELAKRYGRTQHAFKQTKPTKASPAVRSIGKAAKFKVIDPQRTVCPEVGSEGIVANLVTHLQRGNGSRFVVNPGPDEFRDKKICVAFIVTDFVGSGHRTKKFLDAFWQMRTVRSWRSYGLVSFHVMAFSATASGVACIRAHPIRPDVHWVAPCPTIDTVYAPFDAQKVKDALIRSDPKDKHATHSLGYDGQGAMLIFSHGCPNNAPRALWQSTRRWKALFVKRSNLIEGFDDVARTKTKAVRLLAGAHSTLSGQHRLLVMAALREGHKVRDQIAIATGLDIADVEGALTALQALGWVSVRNNLTALGHLNLKNAGPFALRKRNITPLAASNDMYYPKSLRAPV